MKYKLWEGKKKEHSFYVSPQHLLLYIKSQNRQDLWAEAVIHYMCAYVLNER